MTAYGAPIVPGVEAPIVLGPFGGLSSIALTAAVSDLGGLGSYGFYGYSATRIAETLRVLRDTTSRPFAVNLWLPLGDEVTPAPEHARYLTGLAGFFEELGLEIPEIPESYIPSFEDQIDAVLDEAPAAVSFVYGVPPRPVVDELHRRGSRVLGTATTVAEARALEDGGVDAVIATGMEAAGHRVSFLRAPEDSLVGLLALVPQVVDAVSIPVIAAGGVSERRQVRAARALGAAAVQSGTAFLATKESAATDAHRAAIRTTAADESVLTRAMSGRLARGRRNRAVEMIETAGIIAPFPAQNWASGKFRAEASARNLGEFQSLWLGQSAPLARGDSAAEVFSELLAGFAD